MKINSFSTSLDDPEFEPQIAQLVSKYSIQSIVETGTFYGNGSTKIFAKTGLPVTSIECNPSYAESARSNLSAFKNVTVVNGYSLSRVDMEKFIMNDSFMVCPPASVMVDVDNQIAQFYLKELDHGGLPQNLLLKYADNPTKQILFLDSAGGIGYMEYVVLMSALEKSGNKQAKLLVLDDISHIKHWRSWEDVENKYPNRFKASSGRWGWADLSS